MTLHPLYIPALTDTLRRVAYLATLLQPKGLSLRFINHDEGDQGEFDNLTNAHVIASKISSLSFTGGTRLGSALDDKIIQPLITSKIASGRFERPVFVVIITDGDVGAVHGLISCSGRH
jgi:hypothetical protein